MCAGHRSRPAWGLPPPHSTAFAPASVAFHSWVHKRLLFASTPLLICPPSAVCSCPSCSCHHLRLTRQSTGRRISWALFAQPTSRGAGYFYVSPPHITFMSLFAILFGRLQAHRSATPVFIGSLRSVSEGRRSMRVSNRSCFSLAARASGFLSGAQSAVAAQFRLALVVAPFRLASALAQSLATSPVLRVAQAASQHSRRFSVVLVSRFVLQSHAGKTAPSSTTWANPALNLAPFGRWTLRDKAAQRRLALR